MRSVLEPRERRRCSTSATSLVMEGRGLEVGLEEGEEVVAWETSSQRVSSISRSSTNNILLVDVCFMLFVVVMIV